MVSHSQPMPIMPLIFITIHPFKLCSALFLPWVFSFYYTSVTLFSSPSQIPRCPFNTCPSRCSSSPVFIIFLCCTHTIPVVVSLSFTPHPLTHTKTLAGSAMPFHFHKQVIRFTVVLGDLSTVLLTVIQSN